jgi:hypothetical protein
MSCRDWWIEKGVFMRAARIEGREYPVQKIFSSDFAFRIPKYQRPYAWTTEHAGKLLDDLLGSLQGNDVADMNPYFIGSLVLIKRDEVPEADVVDGQQRLTTLTILLAALRGRLRSMGHVGHLTEFLLEEGNPLTDTPNHYRLTLRERDAAFFQTRIQNDQGLASLATLNMADLSESQRNVALNATLYINRLRDLPNDRCELLAKFILTRCYLVAVSTPDLDSAYRIFSVLNDRGLNLSHTDILKAETIGQIEDRSQDAYVKKWEDTEDTLGRERFQDLFSHIRMIYRKAKLRDTVLVEFRQYVKPTENPPRFIDDVLLPYAEAFDDVANAGYESTDDAASVNRSLRWLNQVDNFDWIPPAIAFLSKHRADAVLLQRFMADLERLAVGMMVLRYDVNGRIERYANLLTAIMGDADVFAAGAPLQLTTAERADVMTHLDGDIYSQTKIRLYVLRRLDSALSQAEASYNYSTITVEHVLPQSPNEGSRWISWFPDQAARESWTHRIANLVLLSRRKNSQARNFEFDVKKDRYFTTRTGTSPFAITTQVLRETEWTPAILERRQDALLTTLKQLWRLT